MLTPSDLDGIQGRTDRRRSLANFDRRPFGRPRRADRHGPGRVFERRRSAHQRHLPIKRGCRSPSRLRLCVSISAWVRDPGTGCLALAPATLLFGGFVGAVA